MKVAVITRHAISNYGSLLQAYATQKVFEKLGKSCEIIDYVREDESYKNHEKTLLKQKSKWNNNCIKRAIYLALRQPGSIISGKRFEKERAKYLKLTKKYISYQQLEQDIPEADLYVTGSDQVWGPTEDGTYDPAYCLNFTKEGDKCISYAASFGRTLMTPEIEDYFKNNLKKYSAISVREDSACDILKNIDISAEQVLDPTLLLSAEEWRNIASKKNRGRYVLIYQLHNDPKLGKYAKKVAQEKGLPLIRISTHLHQIFRHGKFIWNPEIKDFISYIDQAECLVTDSFHGTAFAINLNTQFVEVLPNNNTGTRNQSILKLTGLEKQILTNLEDVELANRKIDFNLVNEIIKREREQSIKNLKSMIDVR